MMGTMLENSVFFGVVLSIASYMLGTYLKKKFKLAILNPLLVSVVVIIGFLLLFNIDYDKYNEGAQYLSYLLTPVTVCLAIPLYQQFELLKKNIKAVILGITSGVLTSLTCIFIMSIMFRLNHQEYVTILTKSITTAIGLGVSEELGGYVNITCAVIMVTGILGNVIAEFVCKIFRINEPVAKGIAIGTASHAIGTTKAMEMGEAEGAMSSLSIAVAGLLTVVFASIYAQFI